MNTQNTPKITANNSNSNKNKQFFKPEKKFKTKQELQAYLVDSVELTKKHKSKLLEMCEELFTEYRKDPKTHYGGITFHHHDGTKGTSFIRDSEYLWGFKPEDGDTYDNASFAIHWFEFCCKKLAFQIYNFNIGKTKTTYSTFVAECIITSTFHPVDYLYEEFKKLK